jgi:hypothetical protein
MIRTGDLLIAVGEGFEPTELAFTSLANSHHKPDSINLPSTNKEGTGFEPVTD